MPSAKKSEKWNEVELDSSINTYMEMLSKEQSGIRFKKTDYKGQSLKGALSKRSPSAFEYRMQNISFVLKSLGQKHIRGYLPAAHVGTNTFNSICRSLEKLHFISVNDFQPTAGNEKLQQRTTRIRKNIDLKNKPKGQPKPEKVVTATTIYYRDPLVRAWVLEKAKGKCEACDVDAPFVLWDGIPFLEVHHMIPLAAGGPDTVENALALCPNCHRRSHLSRDKESFNNAIYRKIKRLIR